MKCYTGAVKIAMKETFRSLIPLIILAFLFLILVALQFQWTGEISREQRRESQERLDEKLTLFARDFDQEITRLYYSFFPQGSGPLPSGLESMSRETSSRWVRWEQSSTYPGLVKGIRLAAAREGAAYSFNRNSGRFEEAGRDPDLEAILDRLRQPGEGIFLDQTNLARPLLSPQPLAIISSWRAFPGFRMNPGRVFLVILVDQEVLTKMMIPDLARRYLYRDGVPEFTLSVIGAGNQALYGSGTGSAGRPDEGDGMAELWRLRTNDLVFPPAPGIPEPPAPPQPPSPPPVPGRQPAARELPGDELGREKLLWINDATGKGCFRITARHISGSLGSVAGAWRLRNLALSLGTLSLLAASILLLYLSARQARRAARRQREFLAGVSHELRTPLAVISAGADNLADGIHPADPLKIREYGEMIRNESRRLNGMVEDLLEFASSRSGRKQRPLLEFDPARLVRQAIERSEDSIRAARMILETEICDQVPPVAGDPESLSRAIMNLIGNAVRHAFAGGWLRVELRPSPDGREILISVADRGSGIPSRDLRRIFLPFERGAETTMKQIRGAGIGLSLVQEIMEEHRGRVTVESHRGQGSRFTLHLPAAGDASGKKGS